MALLSTLALQPAFGLLGKKWPRVANALQANQGALQLGYGTLNFGDDMPAHEVYREALLALMRQWPNK